MGLRVSSQTSKDEAGDVGAALQPPRAHRGDAVSGPFDRALMLAGHGWGEGRQQVSGASQLVRAVVGVGELRQDQAWLGIVGEPAGSGGGQFATVTRAQSRAYGRTVPIGWRTGPQMHSPLTRRRPQGPVRQRVPYP